MKSPIKNLMEALQILLKYDDKLQRLAYREGDTQYILIGPADVSGEDREKLDALGFFDVDVLIVTGIEGGDQEMEEKSWV